MILDTINNLGKYTALNPLFAQVVEFIAANDLAACEQGIVELQGKDLFANFTIAKGKTKENARLETHNAMIDIQIPISCSEMMGVTPREKLSDAPYNADKDITFYEGLAEQYITVHPGEFAIFFPQDGHAPCVSNEPEIQKVIFKVKA